MTAPRAIALLLVLGACDAPSPPWAQPPEVPLDLRVTLSRTDVRLLEPITVDLDLYRRDGLDVTFAPEVPRDDFLVEQTTRPERAFGDGRWRRTTFVLRPVRGPGELVLPPFAATAADGSIAATTPARTITVASSLDGAAAAIEAPGDPLPPPSRLGGWLGGGALATLAIVLAWFGLQRARRERPAVAAVALPPHVKAQRALERLRAQPRATAAEVEAFYVQVSDVLRVYLEERFGLRAPERTTEEFLRDLEGGDRLAREHRRELERFLSQCDLVKFAAARPTEQDHLATFALAEAFVATTAGDRQHEPQPAGVGA